MINLSVGRCSNYDVVVSSMKLEVGKASESDKIINKVIKELPRKRVYTITTIINIANGILRHDDPEKKIIKVKKLKKIFISFSTVSPKQDLFSQTLYWVLMTINEL